MTSINKGGGKRPATSAERQSIAEQVEVGKALEDLQSTTLGCPYDEEYNHLYKRREKHNTFSYLFIFECSLLQFFLLSF
jgi:hypothetical protein